MKRKNNIMLNLILVLTIITMFILPLPTVEAASFTVSKSNVSLENGKTSTITINAPTHTGRIDIISSNSSIASVSDNSLWVENGSKTITILGKSVGTATITIKGELFDADTEEESTYTKTINVTVTKANTSGSTNTGSNSSGTTGGTSSGTQSGGNSSTGTSGGSQSGSISNNNQNSNTGNNNSGGQVSNNTNKPSSGSTSSSSNVNSKPSSSNTSTTKPSNSVTSNSTQSEQTTSNINTDETLAPVENTEEVLENEESLQEETLIEQNTTNVEVENVKQANSVKFKGKTIIIVAIGSITFVMILIGIGISKNILKK